MVLDQIRRVSKTKDDEAGPAAGTVVEVGELGPAQSLGSGYAVVHDQTISVCKDGAAVPVMDREQTPDDGHRATRQTRGREA